MLFELDPHAAAAKDPQHPDSQPQAPEPRDQQLPPLLQQLLAEYSATGMPPAYLPKSAPLDQGETS